MTGRNPYKWKKADWKEAWSYFQNCYGKKGMYYEHLGFDKQPPVTMSEFRDAVLADYEAAFQCQTEHPLFGVAFWEWASVERESVRDRILIARGHRPIGYFGNGVWGDNRFGTDPVDKTEPAHT